MIGNNLSEQEYQKLLDLIKSPDDANFDIATQIILSHSDSDYLENSIFRDKIAVNFLHRLFIKYYNQDANFFKCCDAVVAFAKNNMLFLNGRDEYNSIVSSFDC